jgi:hypothetical protein
MCGNSLVYLPLLISAEGAKTPAGVRGSGRPHRRFSEGTEKVPYFLAVEG